MDALGVRFEKFPIDVAALRHLASGLLDRAPHSAVGDYGPMQGGLALDFPADTGQTALEGFAHGLKGDVGGSHLAHGSRCGCGERSDGAVLHNVVFGAAILAQHVAANELHARAPSQAGLAPVR